TYDPTIEDSYRKQVVIDDHACVLEVLDTAGQERFHDQITRVRDESVPLMLVGNKCDKITEREVSREEGMNMARRLKCDFIESSAKTCVNVERPFYCVVKMIRQNREGGKDIRKNKKKFNDEQLKIPDFSDAQLKDWDETNLGICLTASDFGWEKEYNVRNQREEAKEHFNARNYVKALEIWKNILMNYNHTPEDQKNASKWSLESQILDAGSDRHSI
ncbi:18633_t:CDS:2, partial [Gigaspora margarita]